MTGFVMAASGFNANGLVGDFDGNEMVVINGKQASFTRWIPIVVCHLRY